MKTAKTNGLFQPILVVAMVLTSYWRPANASLITQNPSNKATKPARNEASLQNTSLESREDLRLQVENFVQEEDLKDIRVLCSLQFVRDLRVQLAHVR
jgi:hypothetical protein